MALHLIQTHEGEEAKRASALLPPLGPGLTPDLIQRVARIEVWGTSFDHPGNDFCEFRAFDADGGLVASRRVEGY